jgi:Family of unknown function (DUF5330)
MRFLFRLAFWFSLVLMVIPFGGPAPQKASVDGETKSQPVGLVETFLAAREAITDFIGLCERKPEVCQIGRAAMTAVGLRAREAAQIAFELLDEKFGGRDETLVTGSVPPEDVGATPRTQAGSVPVPTASPNH